MPKGSDWFNFIYVNMAYLALIFVISIFLRIKYIRKNWPKYRCNPVYMPLGDDVGKNFAFCVQNMQSNYMGYLLQPIWYLLNSMQSMSFGAITSIQGFRKMIAFMRGSFGNILGAILGMFSNIVIQFRKIMIAVKDSMAKMSAVMVTFMYMMDGTRMTVGSVWSGPPGQMVRALCFSLDTSVTLKDGSVKKMKDVCLGDLLASGSRVIGTMRVANTHDETFFRIIPHMLNVPTVLVTGSHYVYNEHSGKYCKARNHPRAVATGIKDKEFVCLITDDHKICIEDLIFWDWDDDLIPSDMKQD